MLQATLNMETKTLLKYLNAQREHVVGILDGLDEASLRRPILPSGWTCLGLVQHLANMERFWFRCIVAGQQAAIAALAETPDDWQIGADVSVGAVFDLYRRESARADEIIAATPLDAAPAWWPDGLFGDWRLHTLREIILHTMTETACHSGHLDAVRELIDGRLWMVLNE